MASVLALASRVSIIVDVVCARLPVYGVVNGLSNTHVGRAITGLSEVPGAF
jgi:hypothetical protein